MQQKEQYQSSEMERIAEANIRYARFVSSRAKPLHNAVQDVLHAAVGMSGEAGELLDAVKKCWIYERPMSPEVVANLKEEAGDSLFYIQMLCNILGCSLQELINENIEKLCNRYPNGYSNAAALARADKPSGE